MYRVRNIEVIWRECSSEFFVVSVFVDWYDFADWLKQKQLKDCTVEIKGWRYIDWRV